MHACAQTPVVSIYIHRQTGKVESKSRRSRSCRIKEFNLSAVHGKSKRSDDNVCQIKINLSDADLMRIYYNANVIEV